MSLIRAHGPSEGKENVGKFSLHNETSPNRLRLIVFAEARNIVVYNTRKNIKLYRRRHCKSRNQINQVVYPEFLTCVRSDD